MTLALQILQLCYQLTIKIRNVNKCGDVQILLSAIQTPGIFNWYNRKFLKNSSTFQEIMICKEL